jgi:hypothetical protein
MRRIHSGRPARLRVAACSGALLLAVGAVALTQTAATAASAQRAAVKGVTVRVEGPSSTLLPATTVTLKGGSVTNDGKAADSCSALSALGALQHATKGDWSGTWSKSYSSYFITGIRGVNYPASASYYWAFWVNNAPAAKGACNIDPKPGASILFFPQYDGKSKEISSTPSVLGVSGPASVLLGKPFTLSVSRYANATGKRSAADGALVSGGGKSAATGANGEATLAIAKAGEVTIDVSAANSIRTEATVCVHAAGATCTAAK